MFTSLKAENYSFAISVCPARETHRLRRLLSRHPHGLITVPKDERPPSRAYSKVLEAEIRMGRTMKMNEHVVDLGACPGQ
jgi:23S rRNA (cytidine2498-2'-O)-methyltransferase